MSAQSKTALETTIDTQINTNGNNEITGAILNTNLKDIVDSYEDFIPSLTTAEINALSSPTLRQIVFDTDRGEYRYYDGTRFVSFAHPKYEIYEALLTQTGTGAPVATVSDNGIGNIVWTRPITAGNYVGTLSGAFTAGKTFCYFGGTISASSIYMYPSDTSNIQLETAVASDGTNPEIDSDEILLNTPIKIIVYY